MKDFSTLASPLDEIVKKNVGFKWGSKQEEAFHILKEKLTHALILSLPNFAKSFEVECDASNCWNNQESRIDSLKFYQLFLRFN